MRVCSRVRDLIDDPIFNDMTIECQLQLGSQVSNYFFPHSEASILIFSHNIPLNPNFIL